MFAVNRTYHPWNPMSDKCDRCGLTGLECDQMIFANIQQICDEEWVRKYREADEKYKQVLARYRLGSAVNTQLPDCHHEFVSYTGLNETFEYCKKCDQKRS